MRKLIGSLIVSLGLSILANAMPPVDRYGGRYEATPDTTTGVRYKFYVEPNINDFEYRSMMDSIYAIWKDTSVSECSRWRTVNLLLETRVDPYLKYPPGVSRSTIPFDSRSLVFHTTTSAVNMGYVSTSDVKSSDVYSNVQICGEGFLFESYISDPMEAEVFSLTKPMFVASSPNASWGKYIMTSQNEVGRATFTINVPYKGSYILWALVYSTSEKNDSFYVSVDNGPEDIFDTSENKWSTDFQWTRINGRGGTATPLTIDPRTFDLDQGTHTVSFRGRNFYTGLDKVVVTNEMAYVPR